MRFRFLLLLSLIFVTGCAATTKVTVDNPYRKSVEEYRVLKSNPRLKHGRYVSRYLNGNKMLVGSYKNGKMHGHFTRWNKDGSISCDYDYVDGKLHGYFVGKNSDGAKCIECEYDQDIPKGFSKTSDYFGNIRKQTEWHDNGVMKSEKEYENGLQQGLFKEWNSDGELVIDGYIMNGKLSAKVIEYYVSGDKKSEIVFRNGEIAGDIKEWDDKGNPVSISR